MLFLQQNKTYEVKLLALTFSSWQGHQKDKQRKEGPPRFPHFTEPKYPSFVFSFTWTSTLYPHKLFYANKNLTKAIPMQTRAKPIPCVNLQSLCKLIQGTLIIQALHHTTHGWQPSICILILANSRTPHHAKNINHFHAKMMLSPYKDTAMRQTLHTKPYNSRFYAYG